MTPQNHVKKFWELFVSPFKGTLFQNCLLVKTTPPKVQRIHAWRVPNFIFLCLWGIRPPVTTLPIWIPPWSWNRIRKKVGLHMESTCEKNQRPKISCYFLFYKNLKSWHSGVPGFATNCQSIILARFSATLFSKIKIIYISWRSLPILASGEKWRIAAGPENSFGRSNLWISTPSNKFTNFNTVNKTGRYRKSNGWHHARENVMIQKIILTFDHSLLKRQTKSC
jgi:hypothetical protein